MVDIQKKIKDLLILVRMKPIEQDQVFRREIFKAKINISIQFKKYDLQEGQLEYEFKKTKKEEFSNKIDCRPRNELKNSFISRHDDHGHGHHHPREHPAHFSEGTRRPGTLIGGESGQGVGRGDHPNIDSVEVYQRTHIAFE